MLTALTPPKATAVISNGWARRQRNVGAMPRQTASDDQRHAISVRRAASVTAPTTTAANSVQSRQLRAGGSGTRGSSKNERTAALTTSAYGTARTRESAERTTTSRPFGRPDLGYRADVLDRPPPSPWIT